MSLCIHQFTTELTSVCIRNTERLRNKVVDYVETENKMQRSGIPAKIYPRQLTKLVWIVEIPLFSLTEQLGKVILCRKFSFETVDRVTKSEKIPKISWYRYLAKDENKCRYLLTAPQIKCTALTHLQLSPILQN